MVITDQNKKIKIDDEVIKGIYFFCQMKKDMPEAGGILVGRENISNDNLIIEYFTQPLPNDYQSRTRFKRKDRGHLAFFEKLYIDSKGTFRYVGEWHTHPEDIPCYSIIDYNNWRKIYKECNGKQIHYHFIAGRKAIVIWKYKGDDLLPIKLSELYWDDLFNLK